MQTQTKNSSMPGSFSPQQWHTNHHNHTALSLFQTLHKLFYQHYRAVRITSINLKTKAYLIKGPLEEPTWTGWTPLPSLVRLFQQVAFHAGCPLEGLTWPGQWRGGGVNLPSFTWEAGALQPQGMGQEKKLWLPPHALPETLLPDRDLAGHNYSVRKSPANLMSVPSAPMPLHHTEHLC